MMVKFLLPAFLLFGFTVNAASDQSTSTLWVDSIFNTLSKKEKITQLMIIRAHSNKGIGHVDSVTEAIKKYRVGGLCFFQGGPVLSIYV